MKKIAILTSRFPVLSETFVGNEMRALQRYGHPVQPVAMQHSKAPGQLIDYVLVDNTLYLSDLKRIVPWSFIRKILINLPKALPFVVTQSGLSRKSLLWNGVRLAYLLKQDQIQHIHAHFAHATAAHAIVAAKLLNISVSFVGHGSDIYVNPIDLPKKLKYSTFAVAVCKEMHDDFAKHISIDKIKQIHCGIDPYLFTPIKDKKNGNNGKLLYVGRLSESKGVDQIVQALALMDEQDRPVIDLVGDGTLMDGLKVLVTKLGLVHKVNFLGAKDAEWLRQHAPHYVGLVAPFQPAKNGAKDTGPLVVKEAMAMCLPVISTRFMGIKDIVTDKTGILIEVGDVNALAEAMLKITEMDEVQLKEMGLAGRNRVLQYFTLEKQVRQLSSCVEAA